MEVTRQQLGAGDKAEFRARQLRARDMLRGALDGPELEEHVEQSVLTTTLEKAGRWAVGNANFPLSFGLACCAIEWMSHIGPRLDIARFGFEAARATPRQADTIFLSGRISIKMAPVIRRIYEQMLEPRYVIAMGACSSSMGVFNNYALVPGDKFLPVDVHVPGCPPRPGVARARDPQAARRDPLPARRGLAHALRRPRHRGGRRRALDVAARRSTCPATVGTAPRPECLTPPASS